MAIVLALDNSPEARSLEFPGAAAMDASPAPTEEIECSTPTTEPGWMPTEEIECSRSCSPTEPDDVAEVDAPLPPFFLSPSLPLPPSPSLPLVLSPSAVSVSSPSSPCHPVSLPLSLPVFAAATPGPCCHSGPAPSTLTTEPRDVREAAALAAATPGRRCHAGLSPPQEKGGSPPHRFVATTTEGPCCHAGPASCTEDGPTRDFAQGVRDAIAEDSLLSLWYRGRECSPPHDPAAAAASAAAADASALAAAIEEANRRYSERLRARWAAASHDAELRRLHRVSFHECPAHGLLASDCGGACLEARALTIAADSSAYYIGTTVDPCRRWLGGSSAERGVMVGHRARFERMAVIGVDQGWTAGRLEGLVIGRRIRSPRCENKVADSRGCPRISESVFVYVAYSSPPDPPALVEVNGEDIE
jgi:hypothetical protein